MALSDTAADLAYVRASSGDTDSNDYYNTDDELDYLYANKAGNDLDKTIVWALRYMKAKAFRKVSFTNSATGDVHQRQQEWDHIRDMLAYWESITGLAGTVTEGIVSLGIDEESPDVSNP